MGRLAALPFPGGAGGGGLSRGQPGELRAQTRVADRQEPQWWRMALRGLAGLSHKRKPVSRRVYRQWLRLVRHPMATTEEWQAAFGGGG